MFIAMEIYSNVTWMPFPLNQESRAYFRRVLLSNPSCSHLGWLGKKVQEQLLHIVEHKVEQLRRFLQDMEDNPFTPEPEQEPEQEPPLIHTPRHDAESVFWLLWFLLARANPESEAPVEEDSAQMKTYDIFCSTMLNYTVGAPIETRAALAQ